MWRPIRWLAAAMIAAALSGCAYVDSVSSRYDNVNRNADYARNQAILLNIVRASESAPLNFVAFSRVTAGTTANASAGLPTFALGPTSLPGVSGRDAIISDRVLNGSTGVTNSMDLTVLDSHDFYTALLNPVDLPTLTYFIQQGYSRELLFRLFTDSVRMQIGAQHIEFRNEPGAPCYKLRGVSFCFDDVLHNAIGAGLTAETKLGAGSNGKIIFGRFCFDPILAQRAFMRYPRWFFAKMLARPTQHRPLCGKGTWHPQTLNGTTDTLTFDLPHSRFGHIHFRIITRSTFGIYQYLGRVLAEGKEREVTVEREGGEPHEIRELLAVTSAPSDGCFVKTTYRGSFYCVPNRATYTKRIFSLLAQLIALKTHTSDLAVLPTVRVAQ